MLGLRTLLQPASCMGIALGRDSLTVAHGRSHAGGMRVEWVQGVSADGAMLGGDYAALHEALCTLLADVTQRIGREYIPIQVALPDPVVDAMVLELEELPKSAKTREELVRWHLAKRLQLDEQTLQVTFQTLGGDGGHQLLMGLGVAKGLLEAIDNAFKSVGIPVSVIDMGAGFRHNYFLPRIDAGSGALVCLEPDYWTLSLWDDTGRLRHLRSRWREIGVDARTEHRRLAAEVERTVMAYVHAGAGRHVERLYAASLHEDVKDLCTALDERTHDMCVPVETPAVPSIPVGRGTLSLAAVASAQCRA